MRHPFTLLVVALLTSVVAGCAPRWAVVAQAVPDPLVGATNFYIEPVHFDPPMVGDKTEREYLADKTPDQRDSWMTDKTETSGRYARALIEADQELHFAVQPAPGLFIIRPVVTFIEPGFYAFVAAAPTQVRMTIQVLASTGTLTDEIAVRSVIPSTMIYASSGSRLRAAGEDLGKVTAEYLRKRVRGE